MLLTSAAAHRDYLSEWPTWAALAFSVISIGGATLFRLGHWRSLARNRHRTRHEPRYVRNAEFSLLPAGLIMGIWFLALANSRANPYLLLTLLFGSWLLFIPMVLWMRKPPEFLKPQWLKEEEGRRHHVP